MTNADNMNSGQDYLLRKKQRQEITQYYPDSTQVQTKSISQVVPKNYNRNIINLRSNLHQFKVYLSKHKKNKY